jgi:hypothetical protein
MKSVYTQYSKIFNYRHHRTGYSLKLGISEHYPILLHYYHSKRNGSRTGFMQEMQKVVWYVEDLMVLVNYKVPLMKEDKFLQYKKCNIYL